MKKYFLDIIILIMIAILIVGCSRGESVNNTNRTPEPTDKSDNSKANNNVWADVDISKEEHIVGYLIGEAPKGLDEVLKVLNTKLKKEVNATVEIHYLSWADYKTKYPLILAAGENVDFIFTADWCMYGQEAAKNAFFEITEADLAKYMPRHYANCSPEAFEQAKINGKAYMIGTSSPDRRATCLLYRKDLAEKYGIEGLNKLSDFTPYFKAILENEKDIAPMYLASSYDSLWQWLASENGIEINLSNGLCSYMNNMDEEIEPLYQKPYVDSVMYAFRIMKKWYDAGYVNKDVLPNDITSKEAFTRGKSAIAIGNSVDLQSVLAACQEKGYGVGIIPLLDSHGKTAGASYVNNGVAITASSQNPERTMMVLDLIMEEKDYNYLVYFGIEGTNYVVTKDGRIGLPDGVTEETNTYPVDVSGFWFTNKNQHLPLASWTDDYINLKKKIPDMLYPTPYIRFSPDLANIQSEVADITLITQQYMQPMSYGMIDDVDKGMETLKKKLISAGIEKVKIEVQKQMKEYRGIQ